MKKITLPSLEEPLSINITTMQEELHEFNLFLSSNLEKKNLYPDNTVFLTLEKDGVEIGVTKIVSLKTEDFGILSKMEREDIELVFEENKVLLNNSDLIIWNTGLFINNEFRNNGYGTLFTKLKEEYIRQRYGSHKNIYSLALIYNSNPIKYNKIGYTIKNINEIIPEHSIILKELING